MIREALTAEQLAAMPPDEAAAYFVARQAEGLTASEEELLAAWLAADPDHARTLERAERGWDWLSEAEDHEILSAMRAHAVAPRARPWTRWQPAVAAAVLLLIAASVMFFTFSRPGGREGPGSARMIEYVSAPGQIRQFKLPDGSSMTLDGTSRARGPAGAQARSIELLRGRAFFAVAADPSHPFSVGANERRIIALGTRFDVSLLDDALTVSLLEGRVTVGPADGSAAPVTLRPGQQFVERGGAATIRRIEGAVEDSSDWRFGLLRFDDQTLAEAATQINRSSRAQIVIRDPAVAALRISGEFRAGDSARFAATVAELYPIRVLRRGNEVELIAAR